MNTQKIYTKTGDKGMTSLFGGQRVSKTDIRVETYGTVDELNSFIGLAMGQIRQRVIVKELMEINRDLLEIGSYLATPGAPSPTWATKRVTELEAVIDRLTKPLPVLRNFILRGPGKGGGFLNVARTISRRAERRVIELSQTEAIDPIILTYFNRLSDLLFTMGRYTNHKEKKKEVIWTSRLKK